MAQHQQKQNLIGIHALSSEMALPVSTIRTLQRGRKIPYVKAGHRILLFDPAKVRAALDRFEIKEIGARS